MVLRLNFSPASDNEYDLKEVAKEVKDTLEIVPMKDVETLLKAASAVQ